MTAGVFWSVLFTIAAVAFLTASRPRPRPAACPCRLRAAAPDDLMAIAAAVSDPCPLTPDDLALLDQIGAGGLRPQAVGRGRRIADLIRSQAPAAGDAELSRGVLHVCHVLAWIGYTTGDPGFYGLVVTELGVAAHELTEIERMGSQL